MFEQGHLIAVAKGEFPADLILANARVVNVFTGEVEGGDVALCGEMVAGVLSDEPLRTVVSKLEKLEQLAAELGTTLSSPFATLSFLALPVIPELRLTDLGLVDVNEFRVIK